MSLPANITEWPMDRRAKHATEVALRLRRQYGIITATGGDLLISVSRLVDGVNQAAVMRIVRQISEEVACEMDPSRARKVGARA